MSIATWCRLRFVGPVHSIQASDRTDLSTELDLGLISLARALGRTELRSVAESPPYCMNALQCTLQVIIVRKNGEK